MNLRAMVLVGVALVALGAIASCGGEDAGPCSDDGDCPAGRRCDAALGCVPIGSDGDADADADTDADADADTDADTDADADADVDADVDADADADGDGDCVCPDGAPCCQNAGGGVCADLATDPDNCGRCGHACTENAPNCVRGDCVGCAVCDGAGECLDLQTDPMHCGSCDNFCDVNAQCIAGLCRNGNCQSDCGAERPVCCGNLDVAVCVDLRIDMSNCGECGRECLDGAACVAGNC